MPTCFGVQCVTAQQEQEQARSTKDANPFQKKCALDLCDLDLAHVLFIDAASQEHAICFGVFDPTINTRFAWCEPSVGTQQVAELFGLCAATHIAAHRGLKHFFLFGVNEASTSQLFGLRASIGLKV